MLKTNVNSFFDYHELEAGPFTDSITESELEEEMDSEIKKDLLSARVFVDAGPAESGDIAELRLTSDMPRYNRDCIKLNLGLGLFSKELEAAVIGHSAGERLTAAVDGGVADVEILSVRHRVSAELGDAFASSLGIEGVSTEADYLAYVRKKYIELFSSSYVEYHAMDIFDEAMYRSDIDYSEDDIRAIMKQMGADPDDDPDGADAEDALFILNLHLADCINRGADYQNSEIDTSSEALNALKERVLGPVEAFIKDKCEFIITEAPDREGEKADGCI